MKFPKTAALGKIILMVFSACMIFCTKDYNPFENLANAQVQIASASCSERVRNNETLDIFSTETLAVITSVREKIDSIHLHAENNRLRNDATLLPPFSADPIYFTFSFADTGRHSISVIAYRPDNSTSSIGPLTFYVQSPLKQDSIFSVYGAPLVLNTPSVDDNDVYYWWSFGSNIGDTIFSTLNSFKFPLPDNILPGITGHGSLWVTDLSQKILSPQTPFSFELFRPIPPVISCVSLGFRNKDTVVSGDTLVFSIKVADSSGVGIKKVSIAGTEVSKIGNGQYSLVFTGMKNFTAASPQIITAQAINNVNDTTTQTYFCFYESTNILPDIVKLTLINPTSSITTRLNSVTFIVSVAKLTKDTVSVQVLQNGQALKTQLVTDSAKTLFWDLTQLMTGANTITTQALIHKQSYADTSITITQTPLFSDATPPKILALYVNKKLFTGNPFSLAATDLNAVITVMAFDNESGIATVKLRNKLGLAAILMTDSIAQHIWVSDKIAMPATAIGPKQQSQLNLFLTVTNNVNLATIDTITIIK